MKTLLHLLSAKIQETTGQMTKTLHTSRTIILVVPITDKWPCLDAKGNNTYSCLQISVMCILFGMSIIILPRSQHVIVLPLFFALLPVILQTCWSSPPALWPTKKQKFRAWLHNISASYREIKISVIQQRLCRSQYSNVRKLISFVRPFPI